MRPGTTSRPAASATRLASAGSMFGATRAIFPLAIATSMTPSTPFLASMTRPPRISRSNCRFCAPADAPATTATPIAQHQILVSTVACSFRRGEHLAQPPRDDLVLARPHHPDADDHAAAPLGANRDR